MSYKIRWAIIIGVAVIFPAVSNAAQSTNYMINDQVVNVAGNTYTGSGKMVLDSMGEAAIGQIYGEMYSIQTGFFNDYYILPPTPTVTPTVTVTHTPIRTFNGEIVDEQWVYAVPNPIRGKQGRLVFHLAESAQVELKLFTASNQLVLSQHWDRLPAGEQSWLWHAANMANGIYIMYIKAKGDSGKTTIVKKKIALIK